jgi:hypothetical protein
MRAFVLPPPPPKQKQQQQRQQRKQKQRQMPKIALRKPRKRNYERCGESSGRMLLLLLRSLPGSAASSRV